jgi:uncharacterized YceG family protein
LSRGNRSRPPGERSAEERDRAREERARRRAGRSPDGDANGLSDPGLIAVPPPVEPPLPEDRPEIGAAQPEDSTPSAPAPEPFPAAPDPPTADHPTADPETDGSAAAVEPGPDPAPYEEPALDLPPTDTPMHADPPPELPPESPPTDPPAPLDGAPAPEPEGAPAQSAESSPRPEWSRPPLPPSPAWGAPDPRAQRAWRARARRSPRARLGAVIALAAAIAAVVLLVRALLDSRHSGAPRPPAAVKVVIPEGMTAMQIAKIAAADGLTGSYRAAAERSVLLNPARYGAPHGRSGLEGFLFPATYEVKPHAPVGRLVDEQLAAFAENFGASDKRRAHALHLTPYELLIVASMVEREAKVPSERPKIAAVIYNRLRSGMPLGIDATIYYAVELRAGIPTLTHELTEAQLHINSAYNTRTRKGLPPTPISNPGLASIRAAAHPAHVSYLYYVAAADGCGTQVFSTSQAAFEANAAAYQAAVRKNGGRPPVCKKK